MEQEATTSLEPSSDKQPTRGELLARILTGETVTDEEMVATAGKSWDLPDEVVAESLCAAMLTLHKEGVDTMEQIRAVAHRAKMVADKDIDKTVMVFRPMGTLAGMLWKKVDGFCSASEAASKRKLLKGYNRLKRFSALWRGVEVHLQTAWDNREVDEDNEQAAESVIRFVESLTNTLVQSDHIICLEANARHQRLPTKERLLVEAASVGFAKRRAKAKSAAMVAQMGGVPEEDEQPS